MVFPLAEHLKSPQAALIASLKIVPLAEQSLLIFLEIGQKRGRLLTVGGRKVRKIEPSAPLNSSLTPLPSL